MDQARKLEIAMQLVGKLVDKHGAEKAMKVGKCLEGVQLALNCFDEDIQQIVMESLVEIHEMESEES